MKSLLFPMGIILSFNVFSQPLYVCTQDQAIRTIQVVYTAAGQLIPCEVQYTTSTGVETLWSAQRAVGYCENKAEAFADKLQGYGWKCADRSDDQNSPVQANIAEEAAPEVQAALAVGAALEVQEDFAEEVTIEVQGDLAEEVTTEAQVNLTEEVAPEVQANLAEEVVPEVQANLPE